MRRLALLLLVLLPACSLFGPSREGVLVQVAGSDALEVVNWTDARIYYFAVGQETATLIDWAPGGTEGMFIEEGGRKRVTDITRAPDEKDVIFYWWKAVLGPCPSMPVEGDAAGDDCLVAGEMHSVTVRLD